jgi:uncharacterized repeat protein (TIGR02543 family)
VPSSRYPTVLSLSARKVRVAAAAAAVFSVLAASALGAVPSQSASGAVSSQNASAQPSWLQTTPANWSTVASRSTGNEQLVTAGVTLHSDILNTVAGREPAQVLDVDPSNSNVRFGVVNAGSTLINPQDEKISSMAARTGAVAGVNGGYFDINASGQTNLGEIVDGEIWKSPQSPHEGTFGVKKDGSIVIGDERFSGSITDGAATHALTSINWTSDDTGNNITEITPRLGGPTDVSAVNPTLAQGTSTDDGKTITITSVAKVTSLPALAAGTAGLLASGAGATWLTTNVAVGDVVSIASAIAPDNDLQQLVQGPGRIVKNGAVFTDPANQDPPATQLNPETAIGTDSSGQVVMVALDGHGTEASAIGVTTAQAAGYMLDLGVQNAVLLDGGGSTGMVARTPGTTKSTIQNTPSDNTGERPVGSGIFVYSTEANSSAPTSASINGGKDVAAVSGVPQPVAAFAADNRGNPVDDGNLTVAVTPASLGTWSQGVFSPGAPGSGNMVVTDGSATNFVPVTVVNSLASLQATPALPDLDNSTSTTEKLTGMTADGAAVPIVPSSATWSLSDTSLGSIDTSTGVFTAADAGTGLETVTVKVGGASTTIPIAVGSASVEVDPVSDRTAWSLVTGSPAPATPGDTSNGTTLQSSGSDPQVPPGSTHATSIEVGYTMPSKGGVHQVELTPKHAITVSANAAGQVPTSLALWVKIDDPVHDAMEFATRWVQGNGQSTTVYDTAITYNTWTLLKTPIPVGTTFPLTVNLFDLLTINSTKTSAGEIRMSSLQALYSARTPAANDYTAIPDNPSWLTYVESPNDFTTGGQTFLMGDDAHLLNNDQGSASSNVMADIAKRVAGTPFQSPITGADVAPLPANAVPDVVQTLGDMSDDGVLADLKNAQTKIAAIGKPYHDLVGNHEITQGSAPETGGFNSTFGLTHYSYTAGPSQVIALDNSHGGITSSDAFQVPNEEQYTWLEGQLESVTSPVLVVAVHMPADDPFPAKNSQFNDRWEAQQYLQLVQDFKDSHPNTHVIMVYGHARGFSEQILDPAGDQVSGSAGIPQFVFADLGMPAYTTPDRGGFYHFGLVHVTADGKVQVDVEPVLQSLTVDAAAGTMRALPLAPGSTVTLTAEATSQTGDNAIPTITSPVADPMSHVWSSADPTIAKVDPVTGTVTAVAPGTARISVAAGGLTADTTVTVVLPVNAVTVTATAGGTASADVPQAAAGTTVTLSESPAAGFTFDHWQSADVTVDANGSFTMPDAAVSVEALFTLDQYSIQYQLNGGTAAGSNPAGYTVASGPITLSNPTRSGYTFAGWTGPGHATPSTAVTIPAGTTGNLSFAANWTVITNAITYTLAGGSVATSNPTSYTVVSGSIALTNPTRYGYTFAGWTGTGLSAATKTVMIPTGSTGDRSYTATWTQAAPSWSATTVYGGAGTIVFYNGKLYVSLWYSKGEVPGSNPTGSWEEVGAPTSSPLGTFVGWTTSQVYNGGETVVYNGKVYKATWYSRDTIPGDPSGPWEEIGLPVVTSKGTFTSWTASWIYNGGETVAYNGHLWKARFYSLNLTPTASAYGAWQDLGTY